MSDKLFTELSKAESSFGSVLYLRIDALPSEPEKLLANQTIYLSRGGITDIVASTSSRMGLDKVGFTAGLKASRKVNRDLITYRFTVPEDALLGTRYVIQGLGFVFEIEACK